MKIVDVCAFYTPHGGGVKTYIEHKLKIGAALGQEIVIIAPGADFSVEYRPEGGRVIHTPSPQLIVDRRYRYFESAAAVHRILDAEQPDIVEASSPWRTANIVADWAGNAPRALIMHADPLAAFAYRWFGKFSSRATIDRRFNRFWEHLRRVSAKCDMVVSANDSLSARLREGGVAGVTTIPLGVDPGVFSPSLRDPAIRRDLLARCGLGEDATLLLGVGRHSAEKRWPLVISACIAAGQQKPIGLVLLGDGRGRGSIVKHIAGNPHVHLLAPISDRGLLATVMASADALIHGCEAETFGLVAAEAVASGLPLIVPDEGGSSDLVRQSTGEHYSAGDCSSAVAAIHRLLERDKKRLFAATREQAQRAPTIDEHFSKLFAAYQDLQGGLRRAA
jgi:alpha-1,6-mannosyltransferase